MDGFFRILEKTLTLLGLGLIKINGVSANFNNPRPSLILNTVDSGNSKRLNSKQSLVSKHLW